MRAAASFLAVLATAIGVAASPQQPRDQAVAAKGRAGTAAIKGRVVSSESTSHGLARTIVTVRGPSIPEARSTISDDDGGFELAALEPGPVRVSAFKHGFVTAEFGATRPGLPGTPVILTEAKTPEVTISLLPAAVITGTVRDDKARPLPGMRVVAIDPQHPEAPSRSSPSTGALTDDRGVYRIYDLAPQAYIVGVVHATSQLTPVGIDVPSDAWLDAIFARPEALKAGRVQPGPESGQPQILAPIYYPSTPDIDDATVVSPSAGTVLDGIDLTFRSVALSSVAGVIVNPDGTAPRGVQLSLDHRNRATFVDLGINWSSRLTAVVDSAGHFTYTALPPGRYTLLAQVGAGQQSSGGRGGSSSPGTPCAVATEGLGSVEVPLYAAQPIDLDGHAVTGLVLRLEPGSNVAGRVTIDSGAGKPPLELEHACVGLQRTANDGQLSAFTSTAGVGSDGRFEIKGLQAGQYRLTLVLPAPLRGAWWLRSAAVSGADVLDGTLSIVAGSNVAEAVLTITDRANEIGGSLVSPAGVPAPGYWVVLFPADPSLRGVARRVKYARPATDGTFRFVQLPPGSYDLAALVDFDPAQLAEPGFFDAVVQWAVSVRLHDGEQVQQLLRIAK